MEQIIGFIKSRIFTLLLCIIGMVMCFWTISNELAIYGNTTRIVLCTICGISWFNIERCFVNCQNLYNTTFKKIVIIIVAVIAAFGLAGAYYMDNESSFYSLPFLRDFLVTFIWNTPIVLFVSWAIIKLSSRFYNEAEKIKPSLLILGVVGIVVPCVVCLYAFNPGITSYDSVWCIAWSKLIGTVEMIEWHSPFYILYLKALLAIIDSTEFLVAVQCLYFAIIFMKGLNLLKMAGVPKSLLLIFYIFVALSFSNVIQLITIWKDIPFMISLLWLTIHLAEIAILEWKTINKLAWYAQVVVALILISYFRHNGFYVAIVVMILLLICFHTKRGMILTVSVCFVCLLAINHILFPTLKIESSNGQKYMGLFNDISYTYYNSGNMNPEIEKDVNEILSNEPMLSDYDVFQSNVSTNALANYSIHSFLKLYSNTFIEYPKQMLYALLGRTQYIWAVAKPENAKASCVNYLGNTRSITYYDTEYNAEEIKERQYNVLTEIFTDSFTEWTNNSFLNIVFWRTAIFGILTLVAFSVAFSCRKGILHWFPFVPIIFNNLILFASTGSPDYRYYWPTVVVGLFLFLLSPAIVKKGLGLD